MCIRDRYLAPPEAKVLGMIGAGVVNKTSLMAIMAKIKTVEVLKIKGSSPASKTAHELAEFAKAKYPQLKEITVCADLREVVEGTDILCEGVSVEPRKWPVIDPAWIKKGCLIISSGTLGVDYGYTRDHVTKVVDNLGMYEEYINVYQEYDEMCIRDSTYPGTAEPYFSGEAIGVEDALRVMTIGGAYENFLEKEKGSIREGKDADFVVPVSYTHLDVYKRQRYMPGWQIRAGLSQ